MDNEPMCGCVGCDLVQMGRQVHGQINELRNMIDARDKRLDEIYRVAGNSPEVDYPEEAVAKVAYRPGPYIKGPR